jgi:hypothetical protein
MLDFPDDANKCRFIVERVRSLRVIQSSHLLATYFLVIHASLRNEINGFDHCNFD